MGADNVIGLVLAVAAGGLPGRRPRRPGEAVMTGAAWLQFGVLDRPGRWRSPRCSAATWPRCSAPTATGRPATGSSLPVERLDLPAHRRRPRPGAALDGLRPLAARLQPRLGARRSTCCSGSRAALPLNPTERRRRARAALPFNTAVSFVTNTNWQNYAGENTMSHLTQMAGLAVQNFVSAAVGMAVAVALDPGPGPAPVGDDRQLLGRPRPAATSGSCCPLAVRRRRSCSSARASIQNLDGFTEAPRRSRAPPRSIPGGPVASQEAIKELGTNGGGFLNANSAHPFENPNGFTNLLQMFLILLIPFALTYTFGRLVKDQQAGLGGLRAPCSSCGPPAPLVAQGFETGGNPELDDARRRPRRSPPTPGGGNMEGKEVRFGPGRLRAVRRHHHRHVDRRGQLRPRQLHPGRRRGPAGQHDARRGQPGRRRRRPLRHAGLRPPRGVHRRADGGPHAGVPGQEDPGGRDEAGRALHPRRARWSCSASPASRCCSTRPTASILNAGPARPDRGHLRLHLGRQQQRLGLRRPHRQHRLVQHHARPRRCWSAGSS